MILFPTINFKFNLAFILRSGRLNYPNRRGNGGEIRTLNFTRVDIEIFLRPASCAFCHVVLSVRTHWMYTIYVCKRVIHSLRQTVCVGSIKYFIALDSWSHRTTNAIKVYCRQFDYGNWPWQKETAVHCGGDCVSPLTIDNRNRNAQSIIGIYGQRLHALCVN